MSHTIKRALSDFREVADAALVVLDRTLGGLVEFFRLFFFLRAFPAPGMNSKILRESINPKG